MSTATVAACLLLPATAAPPALALPRCRSRYARTGSTPGRSTASPAPARAPGVRRIQRRHGLAVDGIVGPRTRKALGRQGRHAYGSRPMRIGHRGWDVAALQFALETRGFPNGGVDGGFGPRTAGAVRRAQTFYGLTSDGIAGPATLAALSRAPVRAPGLRRPIDAPLGDRYGPRGASFHAGLDFPAPTGTAVTAAATGTRRLRRLRRRLGQHRPARPRQRPAHPLRPPLLVRASASAPPSPPARSSAASAPPARPPARTCTSRSPSAAPTPTQARRSASTESRRDRRARLRCGRR